MTLNRSKKHVWTAEEDAAIAAGRNAKPPVSWEALGRKLHLAPWTVNAHAREVGLIDTNILAHITQSAMEKPDDSDFDRRRECLPAGHPVTWNAITVGTCLEGQRYPL